MKKKPLLFVLMLAMLASLCGCAGYGDVVVLEGLAADLQGAWYGRMPNDENVLVELGFHGEGYHSVTYNSRGEGTLEVGTYQAGEGSVTFWGEIALLQGGGETQETSYTLGAAAEEYILHLWPDDETDMLLTRMDHTEMCPVCREAPFTSNGFPTGGGGGGHTGGGGNGGGSPGDGNSTGGNSTGGTGGNTGGTAGGSTGGSSTGGGNTGGNNGGNNGGPVPSLMGDYQPWYVDGGTVTDVLYEPPNGFIFAMVGKSRIHHVNIINEEVFRAEKWESARASGNDLSDPSIEAIVAADIDTAVTNVRNGALNTGQVRDVRLEITYYPDTSSYNLNLAFGDAELVRIADHLQVYANENDFTLNYPSVMTMQERTECNFDEQSLHFVNTIADGVTVDLFIELYVDVDGYETAEGYIEVNSDSVDGVQILEHFALTLDVYERDNGDITYGVRPADVMTPPDVFPDVV